MNRAIVINVSAPHYNLGSHKLYDWLWQHGWDAVHCDFKDTPPPLYLSGFNLICLSVIFSWDAPKAAAIAKAVKANCDVWAGGPGLFKLQAWWNEQTGLLCQPGLDQRFERQRGPYRMTFASRGCPVGCWFCIVPKLEGKSFTLDHGFWPAPILCDNNLSALPADFQQHIIDRYIKSDIRLLDANSGFEPATFTEETYLRWKPILRGPWRFAFDYSPEISAVRRMMDILRHESPKRKRVYVLIGNEPMEMCFERALRVLEWGGEPYCQAVMPLDALDRNDYTIKHDWTLQRLKHFSRYFNRFLWKYTTLANYRCRSLAPFSDVKFAETRMVA